MFNERYNYYNFVYSIYNFKVQRVFSLHMFTFVWLATIRWITCRPYYFRSFSPTCLSFLSQKLFSLWFVIRCARRNCSHRVGRYMRTNPPGVRFINEFIFRLYLRIYLTVNNINSGFSPNFMSFFFCQIFCYWYCSVIVQFYTHDLYRTYS